MNLTEDPAGARAIGSIGVVAVGVGTFDLDLGAACCDEAWNVLGRLGVRLVGDPTISTDPARTARAAERLAGASVDVVVVLQGTFCDARSAIEIASLTSVPVVVWSFPEPRTGARLRLNSLCGANLAAYSLRRRNLRSAFLHVDPHAAGAERLVRGALQEASTAVPTAPQAAGGPVEDPVPDDVAAARRVADDLRGTVVGVIGDPPAGFEPCEADDDVVRSVCGVVVERVALPALFGAADRAPLGDVDAARRRADAALEVDTELCALGLDESLRLYSGLRSLADAGGWSALSTRCWPECMVEYGGAVCTPQAMMTEDGVPAVCEADLLGSVTALVLQRVAASDPFLADLVDVDEDDDSCVLWHCGVASSRLADPAVRPVAITHPNRHRALVSQFGLRPGRITVARLSQAAPSSDGTGMIMVIGGGEVLARPRPFSGTCGVVRWDRPAAEVVDTVLRRGLEHHLCVVYGDHRGVLAALGAELGIEVVDLTECATTPASR